MKKKAAATGKAKHPKPVPKPKEPVRTVTLEELLEFPEGSIKSIKAQKPKVM